MHDPVLVEEIRSGNYAFRHGDHDPGPDMCVMEAAAYISGEPWSDRPTCVSDELVDFMQALNDACESDEERRLLLSPLLPKVIGTSRFNQKRNFWLIAKWLVNEVMVGLCPQLLVPDFTEATADQCYEAFNRLDLVIEDRDIDLDVFGDWAAFPRILVGNADIFLLVPFSRVLTWALTTDPDIIEKLAKFRESAAKLVLELVK